MRTAFIVMGLIATTLSAKAEGTVSIVVPGRADVPIIINGVDASYAVIEGDWGLARGIHVQPTIYGSRAVAPHHVGRYFPSSGTLPGYGRLEIEPAADRKMPQPAESYYRSYSAQSAPPAAKLEVPFDPPPIIVAPPSVTPNFPDTNVLKNRN